MSFNSIVAALGVLQGNEEGQNVSFDTYILVSDSILLITTASRISLEKLERDHGTEVVS